MRKQVFGRHLKRDTNERKALFKGLASALVIHERIETTEEKAKAVKGAIEKLVTKAKKAEERHARELLSSYLTGDAVKKMITEIAPRFSERPGGYTRILKNGQRFSDNASVVILEWVEKSNKQVVKKADKDDMASANVSTTKAAKTKKAPAKAKLVKNPSKKVATKKATKKETK